MSKVIAFESRQRDAQLERQLNDILSRYLRSESRKERINLFNEYRQLHFQRSPSAVARMESRRGLA